MTTGRLPATKIHVDVQAPPVRAYDVIIRAGALDLLPARIAAAAPASAYAVVVPRALVESCGAPLAASLEDAGLTAHVIPFDDGEAAKTRDTWAWITDRMLEHRLGRDCCVIAVGGGVTGDVAGFVAATYMRGVPFVQVPTSLLAMIDASVGGKTGVDTAMGKNLVGAFHTPRLVLIDPATLRTLPETELRSGLAEALKHGAIADVAYFRWILENADDLVARDAAKLEHLVAASVRIKAGVVAADPWEHGRRAILNFGHTVGHAVEKAASYGLPHGHAVAMGMIAEAFIGEAVGVTAAGTGERLGDAVRLLGLPDRLPFAPDELLDIMALDKKARAAQPRFTLLLQLGEVARAAGDAWTHAVPADTLRHALLTAAGEKNAV